MGSPRRKSIRGRITAMSALSSAVALLLASTAFLLYELVAFRQAMVDDLTTDAKLLAFNATAPLLFDDAAAAQTSLQALETKPRIRAARLFGKTGKVLAAYGEARTKSPPDSTVAAHWFEDDLLVLTLPVVSDGATVGTLALEGSLDELSHRIRRYLLLTVVILLVSVVAAVLIAAWLQRRILEPITQLTEAAGQVSRNQDYSVRVQASSADELGLLINTFNDMLKQIEHQSSELKNAVRMRDQFLTVASHELKTPLTPLVLQVQTLTRQAEKEGTVKMQTRLHVLDRQVHRLSKLVDDLLDISRLTTRRVELHRESFDLAELVRDLAERYESEAARCGSELKVFAPEAVVGNWDRSRLEQVLVNLISNALKYGPGHPIEMTVGQRADFATFAIQDHGIGIREEDLERIFDRFERAVSERNYGGFGLGLWIVRELLSSLGGTVAVHSRSGAGARFDVVLPREMPDVQEELETTA